MSRWTLCLALAAAASIWGCKTQNNPFLTTSCSDGIDNNGDGRTDEDDHACDGSGSGDGESPAGDRGACQSPFISCGKVCSDLSYDAETCGECDSPCADGQLCSAGRCVSTAGLDCSDPQGVTALATVSVPVSLLQEAADRGCAGKEELAAVVRWEPPLPGDYEISVTGDLTTIGVIQDPNGTAAAQCDGAGFEVCGGQGLPVTISTTGAPVFIFVGALDRSLIEGDVQLSIMLTNLL